MRVTASCSVLLAVLAFASACTEEAGTPDPAETRSPGTSSSSSRSSQAAEPSSGQWRWRVVASAPVRDHTSMTANAEYVVSPGPHGPIVTSRQAPRGARPVLRIAPEPGFVVDSTALSGRHVAWWLVEEGLAKTPKVRGFLADLRTGRITEVGDAQGVPAPGLPPTWHLAGHRLAYTTQDGENTNCIAVLDLRSMAAHVPFCTERKEQGAGFPRLGGGAVTFNEWTPRPRPAGCRRVLTIGGGSTTAVPARKKCRPFSGVDGVDGTVVWAEQKPYTPSHAMFFARLPEGKVVRLEQGRTGTEFWCDGWFYWLGDKVETAQLRRWRPGSRTEVVYENDPRWLAIHDARCQGDRITLVRFPNGPGRRELLEAVTPDS